METARAILIFIIVQLFGVSHLLIIPDELPSILSIIYSNIPTIKKGTDSRVGWGFRLGNRADFQVLVEIGPQINTQPLANQGDSANSKRNVRDSISEPWNDQEETKKNNLEETDGGGGEWIKQWSKIIKNANRVPQIPPGARPGLAIGEIDAKSVIPDDSTMMQKGLYSKKKETSNQGDRFDFADKLYGKKEKIKSTTQKPTSTTSAKDALDNVDMDYK